MSKQIRALPLARVERLALVEAGGRSMDQVKAAVGCSHILNSWFYNMTTGKAVGNLKIGGMVKASAGWNGWGLTWDQGPDMRMAVVPDQGGANYLSGVELLTPTRGPGAALSYAREYGGSRGRSAVLLAGETLVLYCSGDGTADARTPEKLRDELVDIGSAYAPPEELRALGLDSGGSSQCDFDGQVIHSTRRVAGYLCVWTKAGSGETEEEEMGTQYRVTPSIGVNIRSGPGTAWGKVGAYPQGTVAVVVETVDGWGRTDQGWVCLDYLEALEPPKRVTDNGIAIQSSYIPAGRKNRPGGSNAAQYITVHETGNKARGADAAAHASYLAGEAGESDLVSWHYTVDDHAVVQHLPDGETAYHAGDGKTGPGNTTSIALEICVNEGGDFQRAQANAAALVRLLMEEHDIPIDRVVQHHHWNGKDCPYTLRHTPGGWEGFLALCRGEEPQATPLEEAVDKLAAAGLINSPDYWKGGVYSAENVQALLLKWAASLGKEA